MLRLVDVTKKYELQDDTIHALRGVSVAFRSSDFVSVLGPSGCGKTTLLNIIGGLDHYSDGDLIIEGKSTKLYNSSDWDDYRNTTIGFVFQSYNLIPHLTVLKNVELALSLSGISKAERRARAVAVLEKTGLGDQLTKKPNQLSGGQMQRVAIARALVNNPKIILADEPTGALDSVTSVQVMDLLQEVARDRLVIMVTHNPDLAEKYSTRIINLFDGLVVGDTNPYTVEKEIAEYVSNVSETKDDSSENAEEIAAMTESAPEESTEKLAEDLTEETSQELIAAPVETAKRSGKQKKRKKQKKATMPVLTAVSLSFSNMFAKKARTGLTVLAGSIGIIGIALVLALSNGFSAFLTTVQEELLSSFPLTITATSTEMTSLSDLTSFTQGYMSPIEGLERYPEGSTITSYEPETSGMFDGLIKINHITEEFVNYLDDMDEELTNAISYVRAVNFHLLSTQGSKTLDATQANKVVSTTSIAWQELLGQEFVEKQYDMIAGAYPSGPNEVILLVDSYNRVSNTILRGMGIEVSTDGSTFAASDLIDKEMAIVDNDDYYTWDEANGRFKEKSLAYEYSQEDLQNIYGKRDNVVKISGIMRVKSTVNLELMFSGILYSPELTDQVIASGASSAIAQKQIELGTSVNVLTGKPFEIGFSSIISGFIGSGSRLIISVKDAYEYNLQKFGAIGVPNSILIYPKTFDSKAEIKNCIAKYNASRADEDDEIAVIDAAETFGSTVGTLVDIVSYVLIAFAAISLVVSSIMIAIITYISVLERTKEIGILRSIGARKSDVSWVFVSETMMLGFAAGLFGIIVAYVVSATASAIVASETGGFVSGIASLNPLHALFLVALSITLTIVSGLIPAILAAKKDPVEALRSN